MTIVSEVIDGFPEERPLLEIERDETRMYQTPEPWMLRFVTREAAPVAIYKVPHVYEPMQYAPPRGVFEGSIMRLEWQNMNGRQPFYHRNADVDEITYQICGERTQMTEFGTVYRPGELRQLCELAHGRGLKVQMDGARFANAVAFLDCHPSAITWRAGVDVLCFGATKNGALAAEAVVFFDLALVRDFELRRKRAGHLFSKSRYIAAQLLAYIETGLWKRNAQRSNALAQRVAHAAAAADLLHPVEGNEIFVRFGLERRQRLRAAGFEFYDWGPPHHGEARLVISWDQPEGEVDALCAALARL